MHIFCVPELTCRKFLTICVFMCMPRPILYPDILPVHACRQLSGFENSLSGPIPSSWCADDCQSLLPSNDFGNGGDGNNNLCLPSSCSDDCVAYFSPEEVSACRKFTSLTCKNCFELNLCMCAYVVGSSQK